MSELPLIFLGGLLGSSHCVGMCGAFAVTMGMGMKSASANFRQQSFYTLGRIFTYVFLGAAAGFAGMRLQRAALPAFQMQALLALVAGTALVLQGLYSAGLLPRLAQRTSKPGYCPSQSLFASFLTAPGWHTAFLAGLLTGFLPCGLVYAYLVLAAGSGTLIAGMAIMAAFGSGTIPLMVLTGLGTTLLSMNARRRLLRAAAYCVIVTGIITIGRGIGWARPADASAPPKCPFCAAPDGEGVGRDSDKSQQKERRRRSQIHSAAPRG